MADVDDLVHEYEPQLVLRVAALRQDYPRRAAEEPYGQRRLHGGRAQQQGLASPEIHPLQLLLIDGLFPVLRGRCITQYPAADGEVFGTFPEHDEAVAAHPQAEQRKSQPIRDLYDEERLSLNYSVYLHQIQHVGQQPEHGAGPSADVFPEPGQQQCKDEVVDADDDKDVEPHDEQLIQRPFRAVKGRCNSAAKQQHDGQRPHHGIGAVGLFFLSASAASVFAAQTRQAAGRDDRREHERG